MERPTERPVEFLLERASAKKATVAGTFNNWDSSRTPMHKGASGWKATLWLPPGRYEYKFVVDGEWVCDPNAAQSAPNGFGTQNSVLVV